VTTHDLAAAPRLPGGDTSGCGDSLGLLTRPLADELAADEGERGAWLEELRVAGALDGGAARRRGDRRGAPTAYLDLDALAAAGRGAARTRG
jgi:hypothetical protein